jgi:hypothetical protein
MHRLTKMTCVLWVNTKTIAIIFYPRTTCVIWGLYVFHVMHGPSMTRCPHDMCIMNIHCTYVDVAYHLKDVHSCQVRTHKWYHWLFWCWLDNKLMNMCILYQEHYNRRGQRQRLIGSFICQWLGCCFDMGKEDVMGICPKIKTSCDLKMGSHPSYNCMSWLDEALVHSTNMVYMT